MRWPYRIFIATRSIRNETVCRALPGARCDYQDERKTIVHGRLLPASSGSRRSLGVYFLSGRKLRRIIASARLRSWAADRASIPGWLFEESYQWVGDLAETLAGIVPFEVETTEGSLAEWVAEFQELGRLDANRQLDRLTDLWNRIGREERFNRHENDHRFVAGRSEPRIVDPRVGRFDGCSRRRHRSSIDGRMGTDRRFLWTVGRSNRQRYGSQSPLSFRAGKSFGARAERTGKHRSILDRMEMDGIRAS